MFKSSLSLYTPISVAILLASCAPLPDLGPRPEIRATGSFSADRSLYRLPVARDWPDEQWWRAYADPQLSALIEEGLKDAPDVAAAVARLRSSEGYRLQTHAALLPSASGTASLGDAKQSYNNGIPPAFVPRGWEHTGNLSLSLDFDLDLWGKNRAALRAATSDEIAAQLDLAQARLLLSTNIASAYADLAQLFAERDVQAEAVRLRIETQTLVARRLAAGLDTRVELKQADAAVPAAQAELASTDESIALTRNRIAALLGKGPDRGLTVARPSPLVQTRGLPRDASTDLIGRRPDIAAARARVEAAAERINVARADFYPSLNLASLVGVQSLGLSKLLQGTSSYGNVTPALSLPIFNGGRIAGEFSTARATYDEAVATYDRSVANAFHEVADAVASSSILEQRLKHSRDSLADAEEAYTVARQRYEGGLSTYLTVLTAEDTVLQSRRIVSDLQSRAFALDIALVRALGGGFEPVTTASAVADATKKD